IGINRKTDEQETEWNALLEERTDLQARVDDYESRKAVVQAVAQKPGNVERAVPNFTNSSTRKVPENIWALDEYRNRVGSAEELKQAYTDGAKRANEIVTLGHPKGDKAHVERLLETDGTGEFAHRVIATSSAEYMRAFGKLLVRRGNLAMLSPSEQRAIATV